MTVTVTRVDPIKVALEERSESFAKLLPKNYPVDRLITGALVALQVNPELRKCSTASLMTALAKVAQSGLDVGDTAHLVPFKGSVTFIPDYKGYIKLMCEAGARKVESREVRTGDEFIYRYGSDPKLDHVPLPGNIAPISFAYAVVTLRGGVTQFEVMSAAEIDKIRVTNSKQWKSGPLEPWYARKTVIRRIAKYIVKSPRLAIALSMDEDPNDTFDPTTGEVYEGAADPTVLMSRSDQTEPTERGDAWGEEQ